MSYEFEKAVTEVAEQLRVLPVETTTSYEEGNTAVMIVSFKDLSQETLNAVADVIKGLPTNEYCKVQAAMFIENKVKVVFSTMDRERELLEKRRALAVTLGVSEEDYRKVVEMRPDAPNDIIAVGMALGMITSRGEDLLESQIPMIELYLLSQFAPVYFSQFSEREDDAAYVVTKAVEITMGWIHTTKAIAPTTLQ